MCVRQSAINELFKEQITFILISLSIGTFLYIAFFEMLAPEKLNETHGSPKFLATFCGFVIIAVIIYFE
uniref:Zinc/iron permease n=1 Tax=Bursaphelenchus xylophilus TaxID=6326 RepID=A0A1I7RZX4_BURXY